MAKQKTLQELIAEAVSKEGKMSESDSKLLGQKLQNLDVVANKVSDDRRVRMAGSRWHATYKFYVDWENDGAQDANYNYCLNPSFEVNVTDDWTFDEGGAGGARAQDATKAVIGSASCKITAGNNYVRQRSTAGVLVPDGDTVSGSCWVRCSASPAPNKVWVRVNDYISQNSVQYATDASNGAWEYVTVSVQNTSGGARTFYLELLNYFSDSSAEVWFDSCQLELQDASTTYIDGTQSDCSWSGTAHNSVSIYRPPWEYDGVYDDMTERFIGASIRRGIPSPTSFVAAPGLIEIELANPDRFLSTDNTDSAIYDYMTSTAKKRCRLDVYVNETTYQLFDGWVREIASDSEERDKRTATIIVDDLIGRMATIPMVSILVTDPSEVVLLSQALTVFRKSHYGACYYGASYYGNDASVALTPSFDTALDSFDYGGDLWKESSTSLLDAINDVMRSCLGYFFVSRIGTPTYENRQERPTASGGADWDASPYTVIDAVGINDDEYYNDISLKVALREVADDPVVVWYLTSPFSLSEGESRSYQATFTDPATSSQCGVIDGINPVNGIDVLFSGTPPDILVSWRGSDAVVTITASGNVTITYVQLRGTPVTRYNEVQLNATLGYNPKKTKWHSAPCLTNPLSAQSYADWLLTLYTDLSTNSKQGTIYPQSPDEVEEMCQVDVGTSITLVGEELSFVNWVHHQIGPGYHWLTVGTTPANLTTMWILGTSELGVDTALGV